jgi:hypothetical protein
VKPELMPSKAEITGDANVEPGMGEMLFPVEPVPLRDLAERSGLGFADVVTLADIPSSTLNRLWKEPDWAARSTGAALHQLVAVMPSLSAYVVGRGFTTTAQRHLRTLSASGIELRRPVRISVEQVAALGNALGVAAAIMNGNRDEVRRRLSLGWGLGHDSFVDAVFASGSNNLFRGGENSLLPAAHAMHEPTSGAMSVASMVGGAVLTHKLEKYSELCAGSSSEPRGDMRSAFMHRSITIAGLLREGDPDLARKYQREIEAHPVLARNERWSLLTYGTGRRLPKDFSMPVVTPHVYHEIIRDVTALNEAYLAYLSLVALPTSRLFRPSQVALRLRFGAALEARLASGISDVKLRCDLVSLHHRLSR